MTLNNYPGVAPDLPTSPQLLKNLAIRINQLLIGKVNIAVEFTPVALATTTVITDSRLTPNSVLLIEPTSAAGSTELASGAMFVDSADREAGECTVTHSVGAATELFRLVILA